MYRARLQWLNSDSRRIFGVIIEQGVCLVLDCKQQCLVRFGQFRNCILKLLKEQIHKISSFNIIRLFFNLCNFIWLFHGYTNLFSRFSSYPPYFPKKFSRFSIFTQIKFYWFIFFLYLAAHSILKNKFIYH